MTIVVLNWNNRAVTLECLASLRRATLHGARLLVVDNGSRDGSAEAVRARFPDVELLALGENRGYAGGNNAGIRAALAAGAGAVLLLNNDTQVAADFLASLLAVLNAIPDAAAVSSAIMRLDAPEVLQEAYFDVYYGFGLIRRRGVNALPGEGFDRLTSVDAAIGCSLLVRREALERVGLLDESYFAYHEEVDWCVRCRKAGWRIFYQPYSRVYHHFSKSTDVPRPPPLTVRRKSAQLPNPIALQWNPVRTYLGARNSIRFIRTHASLRQKLRFYRTTAYAIPLEALAAVTEREEELKLGLLTYRTVLFGYSLEQSGTALESLAGRRPSLRQVLRALRAAPRALLDQLPQDLRRARAAGRLRQVEACLRGHWDGMLDRPLPLEELGLRPGRPPADVRSGGMSAGRGANGEQIRYWNEQGGPKWVAFQRLIDEQIGPLGEQAMDRARIAPGERVIDVGCGCGQTTLELGRRVGPAGRVLGIDVSVPMLARAIDAVREAGAANVRFERVDAQTHRFAAHAFDLVYSRFGVMFFVDPVAAFANLRTALRDGGRLAFVCWQAAADNPWVSVPLQAAARYLTLPPPPAPDAPGPFSLADPDRVRRILSQAGFEGIHLEEVRETLTVGGAVTLDEATRFLLEGVGPTSAALREADPAVRAHVAEAVRAALAPFATADGVRMGSAAWVVTAHVSETPITSPAAGRRPP